MTVRERVNQILEQYLRVFTDHLEDNWYDMLSTAELAYNNAPHSSTSLSPFFTVHGFHPRLDVTIDESATNPAAHEYGLHLAEAWEVAKKAIVVAQARYKRNADRFRNDPPPFKLGDLVKLSRKNLSTLRPT